MKKKTSRCEFIFSLISKKIELDFLILKRRQRFRFTNYELRTMANFTEQKIEMKINEQSGQQFYCKQEIKMSASTKQLIDSDPKLAEDIKDLLEALESERSAEFEKQMNPDAKTEESDSDSEDEEFNPQDRWNCPRQGWEAHCVKLIKEIRAYYLKHGSFCQIDLKFNGRNILGVSFPDGVHTDHQRKFGYAFNSWFILNEHKLDGTGGQWSCGDFGSFWADIALTIPDLNGVYLGCRVSFNPNPNPEKKNSCYFLIEGVEYLKSSLPKFLRTPTSAMFAAYGEWVDWGTKFSNLSNSAHKAERKRKEEEKQQKDAKLRAEQAERRKIADEREAILKAERVAAEEAFRKRNEAESAEKRKAIAEREAANKEAEKAVKAEKARIAEEKAKLNAEKKEAERVAKFCNKKK